MARRHVTMLSSRKVTCSAIFGNLPVEAPKFGAAGLTGGSAMLSEAVQLELANGDIYVGSTNDLR